MLAEIAAEAQHRHRRARLGSELLADVEAVVGAAIDHQDDLQATLDLQGAQSLHQVADGRRPVVDRHDDGEGRPLV